MMTLDDGLRSIGRSIDDDDDGDGDAEMVDGGLKGDHSMDMYVLIRFVSERIKIRNI